MIEFESVSKTFRDGTTAVADLNLSVPSDKITVIVGPSGCGKTTTLRMVNRMLEPSRGRITWDGKALKSRRKTSLRRQMGYVIQSGGLFPHRTVLENIGTVPGLLRWDRNKTEKRSMELLGSVGLDRKLANRYPAQLSGGQQQRVGVARALAADPMVLLMDEPFSAVDPVVRGELHEFFLNLQREISKTIILITHDIDEAIKLGDRVAILRVGGHLAQVGTPQEVLDEPADAFVEGFVGRDRGYRSLSFLPASGLNLERVKVVRDVETAPQDEPTLVVDGDARPVGWADPHRPGQVFGLGSTFSPETDTLRIALDSALTSPFGLAVAVAPDTGRFAGVVPAGKILGQVTESRAGVAESISVRAAEAAGGHEPTGTPAGTTDRAQDPWPSDLVPQDPAPSGDEVEDGSDPDETRIRPAVGRDQDTVLLGDEAVDAGPEDTSGPTAEAPGAEVLDAEPQPVAVEPAVPTASSAAAEPARVSDPRPGSEPLADPDYRAHPASVADEHDDGEDDLANDDDPENAVGPDTVDPLDPLDTGDGRELPADDGPRPGDGAHAVASGGAAPGRAEDR